MTRRSLPFLGTFLAVLLVLSVVGPATAYNNVNPYHLRLSRLGDLRCGTPIAIQAKLTDRDGNKVPGKTIHFAIEFGWFSDSLAPANVVTDSHGKAVTYVTLVCTRGLHITGIVATGPSGARARITLVLYEPHHHHGWDHFYDHYL